MFAKRSDSLDLRIWITAEEAKRIKPDSNSSIFLTTFLDGGIEVNLSTYMRDEGKFQVDVDITEEGRSIVAYNVKLGREAYARLRSEEMVVERYGTFSTSPKVFIVIDDTIGYNPFDMEQFQRAVMIYLECANIDLKETSLKATIGRGIIELKKHERFEFILSLPDWQHARLIYGKPNGKEEYCFWVDTNDEGHENDRGCPYRENQKLKQQIETAWKRQGLPVRKK